MDLGTDIPFLQVGALPYRLSASDEPELLLVTSRGTRQWIIPKGWPMDGLSDSAAAAREAYEEAGILGEIGDTPIGAFTYEKARKGEDALSVFWSTYICCVSSASSPIGQKPMNAALPGCHRRTRYR